MILAVAVNGFVGFIVSFWFGFWFVVWFGLRLRVWVSGGFEWWLGVVWRFGFVVLCILGVLVGCLR